MISPSRAVLRSILTAVSMSSLLALAACNGTAIATLTATPAPTTFLTYRVTLVSVTLQNSDGSKTATLLPSATSVDLAKLTNVDEIFAAVGLKTGNYTTVTIAVDFSNALIVADNGTANGVTLHPVGAGGAALGQVSLTLGLDSANQFSVTKNQSAALALNFDLAASNAVDLSAGTVTVTPMILASALPIDSNPVRVRGTLAGSSESTDSSSNTTSLVYTADITPFDGLTTEAGSLQVVPNGVTSYEINGTPATGAIGQTAFQPLKTGTWTVAYGALTSGGATTTSTDTTSTTTTGTTTATTTGSTSSTDVGFSATQVLAGSSVQGSGADRITGVVTAVNGTTLTIPAATLVTSAGAVSYVSGTTTVTLSQATAVTLPAQSTSSVTNTIAQISVGSLVNVFGSATVEGSGNVTMDATAGRVRLDTTSAWGTLAVVPAENQDSATGVTAASTGTLTIDLTNLGGRSVAVPPFDFAGTGGAGGADSNPAAYLLSTGDLSLANLTDVGQPVEVTGLIAPFGTAGSTTSGVVTPDFVATTLLDPTTINAVLVVNWGGGTATPFNSLSSSEIDLLRNNSSIGSQHLIQIGPQSIDFTQLPSDPLIVPSSSTTSVVYAIGHTSTSTIDNFNTFSDFITALQSELNGTTLATGMTVEGVYTTTSYTLTATNVTVYLTI
jgi:hypothetical protein